MFRNYLIYPATLVFYFFCLLRIHAQDMQTGAGQDFSLSPNDLGALQNSINLYTGQLGFPMTVASLPGRGGLNPRVTIQYNSSGVKQQVNTWNRDAPTGILGLGWSLDFPRIVSDHNQTGTRHDDTFYLVEGGSSNQLVCTDYDADNSKGHRVYEPKNYQPWKVKYYYLLEKWVIEKDDGSKYVYGDNQRAREDGTIQYMVRWGNWIGDSKETEGQSEHAYGWNLSEVINLWDDRLTYAYENMEEEVGSYPSPGDIGNPRHTKSSALKRVTGPTGNYIELNYGTKLYEACATAGDFRCTGRIKEYQDPHVEAGEPDAYQEKYEPRYLENISSYNESQELMYQVDFGYGQSQWIGEGEFTKRVLTDIQQTNYTGKQLPKTEFKYYDGDISKGYLKGVTNSIGGDISYSYTTTASKGFKRQWNIGGLNIPTFFSRSNLGLRDLEVSAPATGTSNTRFTEPDIFMGPDYIVVVWREIQKIRNSNYFNHTTDPAPSYAQIYEWQGGWVRHDMGNIGDLRLSNDIEKHELVATLQKDHFTLVLREGTNDFRVNLFHREEGKRGWVYKLENVYLYEGRLADAQYLTELFLTGGPDHIALGNLATETLYIFTWNGEEWVKKEEHHSTPAGNAYTGAANYVIAHNTSWKPNHFWMHYLSEDKQWLKKTFPGDFTSNRMLSDKKRKDRSYWHSSPTFALAMADDNPEFLFGWDLEFSNVTRESIFRAGDSYPVYWRSNGMFNYANRPEDEFESGMFSEFYRYNGKRWALNRVNRNFTVYMVRGGPDLIGFSKGESRLELQYFNASGGQSGQWSSTSFITQEPRFDRYIKLIPGAALMGNEILYQEPDGSWLDIGEISVDRHGGDAWQKDIRSGSNAFYSSIPYDKTEINRVRNGRLAKDYIAYNMDGRQKYYPIGEKLAGNEMFAAFGADTPEKYNATKFKIYKWSDGNFEGGHEAVVVNAIHVNDGILNLRKFYKYNYATAMMEPSGRFPYFNEVTVTNGGGLFNASPRGYSKYYFHNGTGPEGLPGIPVGQSPETLPLAGSMYRTEMYNNVDELVFSSETVYQVNNKPILNLEGNQVDVAYYARPINSVSREYLATGEKTLTTSIHYNDFGFPSSVFKFSGQSYFFSASSEKTDYIYYPSGYSINNHHIVSEIISSSTSINNETISSNATVWGNINGIPQPVSTYHWLGFGTSAFSEWAGGELAPQWRLGTAIAERDAKGNILSSKDFVGDYESAVYDAKLRNPTMSASYASYGQIAATSFEHGQAGKWAYDQAGVQTQEAYTGASSLSQSSASVAGLPAGDYVLYYWYKDGACTMALTNGTIKSQEDVQTNKGWILKQATVSLANNNEVELNPSGLLDEVRIYPEGAYVSTYVFDGKDRKVAETGPDMRTTYFYYDDLGRQHYISDHQGNIVKHYQYGFMKLME